MCGRYYLADFTDEELFEYLQLLQDLDSLMGDNTLKMHREFFPNDTAPIIANNKNMQQKAFAMKWGYSLCNGNLVINARSETASQKHLFRDGMLHRRCLVPANYYFEWEKSNKQKIKHAINPKDKNAMLMAGIYRFENGIPVFCILTRDASADIKFIHNRMPVILPYSSQKNWLDINQSTDEILKNAILTMEHKNCLRYKQRLDL